MQMQRRGFLTSISAALGAAVTVPSAARAFSGDPEEWLRGLTGQHKQFFDLANHANGAPLARVANFIDVYGQAFHVPPARVNAVLGVHGKAIPLVLNDEVWSTLKLGAHYDLLDSATGAPATRNIFAQTGPTLDQTIGSLQARGVRVIACRKSIQRLAREVAASGIGTAESNRELLERSLVPNVPIVPAMIVAVNQAQEAGLSYVYLA